MQLFLLVSGIAFALLYVSDLITDRYKYKIEMKRLENRDKHQN